MSGNNSVHVLTLVVSGYTLSPMQISGLASEFYGRELDRVGSGDTEKIEIGFDGEDGKKNAESFAVVLKGGFARAAG
jgi:hypothetical protein